MSNVYSDEYQQLICKVKQARAEAKLTQAQVAKRLRKPQSFVSKIESGERELAFIEVVRLAKLYGKPLSYFEP